MEGLKRIRFFDGNPVFAITTPEPFTYGKRARVLPHLDAITWADGRAHAITVARIGTNTPSKLVAFDVENRKFTFEPLTVGFFLRRFPHLKELDTVPKIIEMIEGEPVW